MSYKSPPQGRYDSRLNTTNYSHPQEVNLLDVHRALEYNSLKVVPRPYPEKTDIQWQVSSANNVAIGGQIEGYLISNQYV